MRLIAIDIGASFIKGGLLDLGSLKLGHIQRAPFPGFIEGLNPDFREANPLEIVELVEKQIQRLLKHAPKAAGIVLCSQMHGLVLMNERRKPLSNFISWQDQRSLEAHPSGKGSYFDVLYTRLTATERQELGNETRPGLPITTLFWMAENGLLKLVGEDQTIPCSLPNFVVARLTGAPVCIEPTDAAAHGTYDLQGHRWHAEVMGKLGIGGLRWPTVVRTGDVAYQYQVGARAIPIYTPIGDQQCALAGAFLEDDELSINISTGSQISRINGKLTHGNYQVRPYFDGRYLDTITHIPAGRALNALVRLLGELPRTVHLELPDPWETISRAAAEAGETDLRVDLSFFPSTTGLRGGITNISEENLNIGSLFRAAFRNMADNYGALAGRLAPGGKRPWKKLVFSGGLARKFPLLREMISTEFDCPYRLCAASEDTLLGLLALSLVFTGRAPSVAEAAKLVREAASGEEA